MYTLNGWVLHANRNRVLFIETPVSLSKGAYCSGGPKFVPKWMI